MKCESCGKELIGRQTKFCSRVCHNRSTNKKHNEYQAQQARGQQRKKELVELLGGQCSLCAYKSNSAALVFHHVKDKSFGLDLRKLSNASWDKILQEAQKCILLCANCHAEIHYPDCTL